MFSVIVPLYNKEKSVCKTLQSILNQTFKDFEIIIIDDGSTDKSLETVKNFSDARILIFSKNNEGVSSARNYGVAKARFDYIVFLDADDLWNINYLAEMKQLIADFPNASLWSAYHQLKENEKFFTYPTGKDQDFRNYFRDYFSCLNLQYNTILWTGTIVIKKKAFQYFGGFDPNLSIGEDIDLWFRVALKDPIVFYNRVLATYNITSENRACTKSHPYEKSFLSKTTAYLFDSSSPDAFKSYLRNYIAHNLASYYFSEDKSKVSLFRSYLKFNELPLKWILLYFGPYYFMKKLFLSKKHN